ncbi:dentin sialophosphoprotein-like [Actinia tenebrosa]|uniref:Dentin sialophosphoprotein-like n=1 Tax=Actinia tenebrosa TaxID=6105 RepID=A0A6P8I1M5_ACTTE|nr:dentin sialophosphoprotein-like [Actinia tenebrosa]
MALSEPQVNEISEEQEANELFHTFMDITKDAAIMDHKQNNTTEIEKDKEQINVDNTVEKEATIKENEEKTVELKNEEKTVELKNENEESLPEEGKRNPSKSLSEAVDELSDLEKQLSLMISEGPKHSIQQDNASSTSDVVESGDDTFIDAKEEGMTISVNEEKDHDAKESVPKLTENTDKETVWADEDTERNVNTEVTTECKGDDEKETSGEKNNTNSVDEAKDIEAERSTEVTTKYSEDDVRDTGSESVQEDDPSKPSADGIAESSQNANVEEKKDDSLETSNLVNEDTSVNGGSSQKCSELEVFDQTIINEEKPDPKVGEGVTQDEGVNGKPEDAKEEGSKERSPEVHDDDVDRKAAEIEILMTDESGISERKSLDSLDSLDDDNHHGRPDSPALSDEGIDTDSKSDIGEDDTFDTSSGDFSMKSKSSLLDVDRNRTGSDSSTISEQEFKKDLSDNTDGVIGETSGKEGSLNMPYSNPSRPHNGCAREESHFLVCCRFVLKGDNCLYYYKHSKDKVPCGVIVLCNYSITKAPEDSRKYCFKLDKGGARSYHLSASNEDEMREWMVGLMTAANKVAPDGSSFQISEGNVHNVSIPALSIKDPECHGYLSKKGHHIKNWKRRYCVLKNGYLYYYSDMSNTTALGVAKLLGYTIEMGDKRGKHYCFYGSPPNDSLRTYHFSAETENDRDRWMTRMAESIHKGNHITSE